jgi:hypothetical protein
MVLIISQYIDIHLLKDLIIHSQTLQHFFFPEFFNLTL